MNKITLLILILLSLTLRCTAQQQSEVTTIRLHAQYLYNHGALHWAVDTLTKEIKKLDRGEPSNWLELGNSHQLLSFIYYDIGFIMQGKLAADSMWYYKSKLPDSSIYYVEYAGLRSRFYAVDHNYSPAQKMVDSAAIMLIDLKFRAHLIDTIFFRLNELNLKRNAYAVKWKEEEYEKKLELFSYYTEFPYKNQNDVFKRVRYYRYLGNFIQDLDKKHPYRSLKQRKDALAICLKYYRKGRNEIIAELGYPNHQASLLLMLEALQYKKFNKYQKADSLYQIVTTELSHQESGAGASALQSLSFCLRWNAQAIISSEYTSELDGISAKLKNNWRSTRMIRSKYLEASPNMFKDAYGSTSAIESVGIAVLKLKEKNQNKKWLEDYWNGVNSASGISKYNEALNNQIGTFKFIEFNKTLDSLETLIIINLEKKLLAKKGLLNENVQQLNKNYNNLQFSFQKYFNQLPNEVQRFMQFGCAVSLDDYANQLSTDEATLVYFRDQFFTTNVLIIRRDTVIFRNYNVQDEFSSVFSFINFNRIFPIENSLLDSTLLQLGQVLWYPIEPFLKGIKRIHIHQSQHDLKVPFELIPSNKNFAKSKPLIYNYAFTYTDNLNVDWLNRNKTSGNKNNAVVLTKCGIKGKSQKIPFSNRLAKKLASEWNTKTISNKSDFNTNPYNRLHIATHGWFNQKINQRDYFSQEFYNENYILFCDKPMKITELDSLNYSARLVVLSSCNSGQGYLDRADGRFDFTSIFLKNGSQCVISSPIVLDDQTTAYILEKFYNYLDKGDYASIALQKAKIDFLNEVEDPQLLHPKYWAGLMVYGNDIRLPREFWWENWWVLLIGISLLISFRLLYPMFRKPTTNTKL